MPKPYYPRAIEATACYKEKFDHFSLIFLYHANSGHINAPCNPPCPKCEGYRNEAFIKIDSSDNFYLKCIKCGFSQHMNDLCLGMHPYDILEAAREALTMANNLFKSAKII